MAKEVSEARTRFKESAPARMDRLTQVLRGVGNLANKRYEFSPTEAARMVERISTEAEAVCTALTQYAAEGKVTKATAQATFLDD